MAVNGHIVHLRSLSDIGCLSHEPLGQVRRWHVAAVNLAMALRAVGIKGRLQCGTHANVSE